MNIAKYKSFLAVCMLSTLLFTACYDVEDFTSRYELYRAHVAEFYVQPIENGAINVAFVTTGLKHVSKVDHYDLYYGIVSSPGSTLDTLQATRVSMPLRSMVEKRVYDLDLGVTYAFQVNVVDKAGQSIMSETSYLGVAKPSFVLPSFSYQGYADSDEYETYLNFRLKNSVYGTGTIGVQLADTEADLNDADKTITVSYTGTGLSSVNRLPAEGLAQQHTYFARVFLTLGEKTYYSKAAIITTK